MRQFMQQHNTSTIDRPVFIRRNDNNRVAYAPGQGRLDIVGNDDVNIAMNSKNNLCMLQSGLPLPVVLGLIVLFSSFLNLFVGSASAKWALLAPVLAPMLMLLGVSPEGATAAYRVAQT